MSEHLKACLPKNSTVKWCNAEAEQGLPYDIFVEIHQAENVLRRFIEVKKLTPNRIAFQISVNELLQCEKIARAQEPGIIGRYEVVVVRATDAMLRARTGSVKVVTIDLQQHLRSNQPFVRFADN